MNNQEANLLEKKVQLPLAALRYAVALVMWVWVIDKFVDPAHTARVYQAFYLIEGLEINLSYVIGTVQGLIMLAFTLGLWKRFSYGLVLAMHTVSTLDRTSLTWTHMGSWVTVFRTCFSLQPGQCLPQFSRSLSSANMMCLAP